MYVENKNIFNVEDNSVICITTTGIVARSGALIMGAGIAKDFKLRCDKIEYKLGYYVTMHGNRCFNCGKYKIGDKTFTVASFPTDYDFHDNSDIDLIKTSARQIVEMADKFKWNNIYIPAPGCGLGGLKWEDVESVLKPILDDRFTILFKGRR